ncbi:CRE-TTR-39 protein [Caenorhabditis remanei]|uniref:CRE-TTR-39 protein n=1 Tax=Caenorhabditis remanei TaxID=31234 RepID=E3MM14_CAERE|nr:CRE-TTR-39 protein [Caenorhabditis remanei]
MNLLILFLIPTVLFVFVSADDLLQTKLNETSNSDIEIMSPEGTKKPTRFIDKVRAIGRKQAIGVKGKLMCGGRPVRNATVKLWDNDMFDPDDLIAETHVNEDGTFELSGFAISITSIDPQLRIYHNCRTTSKVCRRKITFTVPDNYINKGVKVQKWFDLGTPNMEIGVKHKEEPHCY